jgi:hypothetical protein
MPRLPGGGKDNSKRPEVSLRGGELWSMAMSGVCTWGREKPKARAGRGWLKMKDAGMDDVGEQVIGHALH